MRVGALERIAREREGARRSSGRVLGAMAVLLVLGFTTPFQEVLAAARWCRAPAAVVELASLMYRYLFLLRDEAATMMAAQRIRLGYTDYHRGVRCLAAVCGMSFARADDRAADVHRAMVCRGYQGDAWGTSPVQAVPQPLQLHRRAAAQPGQVVGELTLPPARLSHGRAPACRARLASASRRCPMAAVLLLLIGVLAGPPLLHRPRRLSQRNTSLFVRADS